MEKIVRLLGGKKNGTDRAIFCGCDTAGEFLQAQMLITEGTNGTSAGTLATGSNVPHGCECNIGAAATVHAQAVCARIK